MSRQKASHVDSAAAVGARVRALRLEHGLLQRDLAFDGCTAAYISRIEAGARVPSLQLLRQLGARLGVSADYLATGTEDIGSTAELALADAQLAQRLGDLDAAEEAFGQLATGTQLRSVERGARLGLAQLALARGEVRVAIELLERYEALTDETTPVEPAAVEALAHAYATSGDLAAALALLERSLARVDDPTSGFRITVVLANVLIDLRQFDRAETLIGDTLAELGQTADPIARARCLWSQSRLQTARGNNDLAADHAREALALIRTTEHDAYAARAHQLLAYIELERDRPAEALGLLETALPLVERQHDETLHATFDLERARALAALGRHDEAQLLAADLVRRVEGLSRVDSARALSVLADVYAESGDTASALSLYEAAAEELQGHENEAMLVDLYRRWSDLLAELGETEHALEVARRAIATRQTLPA
jgi:tetratricopeptide (TPR) repeat protein